MKGNSLRPPLAPSLQACPAAESGSWKLQATSQLVAAVPDKRFFLRFPRAGTELSESPLKKRLKKKEGLDDLRNKQLLDSMGMGTISQAWIAFRTRTGGWEGSQFFPFLPVELS
jgi:hypothetical protein